MNPRRGREYLRNPYVTESLPSESSQRLYKTLWLSLPLVHAKAAAVAIRILFLNKEADLRSIVKRKFMVIDFGF
jgi:hypothetical protein